jgi:hypothetical protein
MGVQRSFVNDLCIKMKKIQNKNLNCCKEQMVTVIFQWGFFSSFMYLYHKVAINAFLDLEPLMMILSLLGDAEVLEGMDHHTCL